MATREQNRRPDADDIDEYIASMLMGMASMADQAGSDYAQKLRAIIKPSATCPSRESLGQDGAAAN